MTLTDINARIVFVFDEDVDDPIEIAKKRYYEAFEVLKERESYDGQVWDVIHARTEDIESSPNAELDIESVDHGITDFKGKMYRSLQQCDRFEGQGGVDKIMTNF
jgi:hypothetical protein